MLEIVWGQFRTRICKKRLYRYGTIGLTYFDDRNAVEKVCDKVDGWLMARRDRKRFERATRRQAWHSFYSMSIGGVVDSPEKIREYERKGYAWATPREFEEVANKAQKRIDAESKERIRAKVEKCARDIKSGRSFIREQRDALEKARRK